MPSRLLIEPMVPEHIPALAEVLRHEAVYRHIGGEVPTLEKFTLGLTRALAGPPPQVQGQVWLNYRVRRASDRAVLGRLEATVHDGIAEVAFLFDPRQWGQGYASEGLLWLNQTLLARPDCRALFATTVPENLRCQALLQRCGYRQTTEFPAHLVSYDEGDWVYEGPARVGL